VIVKNNNLTQNIKVQNRDVEIFYQEREPRYFNVYNIDVTQYYKTYVKSIFGVSEYIVCCITKYLEVNKNIKFEDFTEFQKYIFFHLFYYINLNGYNKEARSFFKILILNNINSYKGWRHFFGLPVNGQRTWSNNNTRYRFKNKLIEFKMLLFKKKFELTQHFIIKRSFYSEYINLLWRYEWKYEWLSARKIFNKNNSKKKYFKMKINYDALLNLQVSTPINQAYKKTKKNRKKIKVDFTVGFPTLYVVSLVSKKQQFFKHLR